MNASKIKLKLKKNARLCCKKFKKIKKWNNKIRNKLKRIYNEKRDKN